MSRFWTWLAASPWASWAQAFASIVIAAAVADWASGGTIDFGRWQAWLIAGLVATLKPLLVAVNPADGRWGRSDAE